MQNSKSKVQNKVVIVALQTFLLSEGGDKLASVFIASKLVYIITNTLLFFRSFA